MAIDNWPPSSFEIPIGPPRAMVQARLDAIDALTAADGSIADWRRETSQLKHDAWVLYHDKHGWPNDANYKAEMLRKASKVVREACGGGAP